MPWGNGGHIWAAALLYHNLPGPWPIHLLPSHFILTDIIATTIRVCTALMLQAMTFILSVCQEWVWEKCVITVLTTRWHSALRQIPWGHSIPQRTPLPSEKLWGNKERERHWQTEEEKDWERESGSERERERVGKRDLCSSLSVCYVWMRCYKDAVFPNTLWFGLLTCGSAVAGVYMCLLMCMHVIIMK